MDRHEIIEILGKEYLTTNVEKGEYSYVKEAGSRAELEKKVGHKVSHYILDLRFEKDDVVVLIETKQEYEESDISQLREYYEEEKALHNNSKIICILANTNDDSFTLWKSDINEKCILNDEKVLDKMDHYVKLFMAVKVNNKEKVLKNTYDLNELLHKMDIDEKLRSQFVGTTLLYIKNMVKKTGGNEVNKELVDKLNEHWKMMDADSICAGIKSTLDGLLGESENKTKKIELLQKNVLNNQKVKRLSTEEWITILDEILTDIFKYIDTDSSEGQDLLNLFFIAFNKYTGKADKNQAFTPDHITEFMCEITGVDRTKVVLDATCGSGSFLVQAMVKEFADCRRDTTEDQAKELIENVKKKHIYGIEVEENAYGLATTNMLIHGDGNSNIKFKSCFDCKTFIQEADPDIILMNPPYNAKPRSIPAKYKRKWNKKAKNGKEDPTKGMVFVHFLSDVIKDLNKTREKEGKATKTVKLAVLLPVGAAIGNSKILENEKIALLKDNTLEAVFSLPDEIFYPGASVNACCMLFTLGESHIKRDGTVNETFFGYYKDDGFRKKKNLGRVEQYDSDGKSIWKLKKRTWIQLLNSKKAEPGLSSKAIVTGSDEWLCEAYMKTDFKKITESDFQNTLNNYLSYLIKEGKIYES